MSFYSYKNANAQCSPGCICTSALDGLNQRICIQVKNVYDSCMQQEQLDDVVITVSDIVPVLPDKSCHETNTRPCSCSCAGNACSCSCNACGAPLSYSEAVENAENANCPLPQPCGQWTFESCRSSTTEGTISNLTIDRLCDRPQFARVKGTVSIPIDVLFTDQRCQEWIGRGTVSVVKDVLLAIPDESIGNGEQHILHHGNRARPIHSWQRWSVNSTSMGMETVPFTRANCGRSQAVDGEVGNRAFRGRRAAAFERPLSTGLRQRAIGVLRVFHGLRIGKRRAAGVAAARASVASAGTATRAGVGLVAGFVRARRERCRSP